MFPSTRLIVALLALSMPASFTAFAVSTGGIRTSAVASQVEITIERWSTAAESNRLMGVTIGRISGLNC